MMIKHMLLCAIKSFNEIKADFERLKKIKYLLCDSLYLYDEKSNQ